VKKKKRSNEMTQNDRDEVSKGEIGEKMVQTDTSAKPETHCAGIVLLWHGFMYLWSCGAV